MIEKLEPIPTQFNGIKYKSRLEARFAEWLSDRQIDSNYQESLPGSEQGYVPDFYLPHFSEEGIFVEVKPEEFVSELSIFNGDLNRTLIPWICVDQMNRSEWRILRANMAFWGGMEYHFPFPCKIDIECVRRGEDVCYLELKFFPEYVTVVGNL